MTISNQFSFSPVGFISSDLKDRHQAPKQGYESAPDAWLEIADEYIPALEGIRKGDELILITWFHQSDRATLTVHPRGDKNSPLTGVFATRSPDRPNQLGLHKVTVHEITGGRLKVGPLEAIDGTPVVDIKPALSKSADA